MKSFLRQAHVQPPNHYVYLYIYTKIGLLTKLSMLGRKMQILL